MTLVLAVGLISLVAAGLLMLSMKLVERRRVTLGDAFVATIVTVLPTMPLLVGAQVLAKSTPPLVGFMTLIILGLGFLIEAVAVRWRFQVQFKRALLVSALVGAFGLAASVAYTIVALLIFPRGPLR
jgi:hypothetical protein